MIGLTIRSLIILFSSVVLIYMLALPTDYVPPIDDEFNALPDADMSRIAEKLWEDGNRESAISVLHFAVETGEHDEQEQRSPSMADSRPLHKQLLKEYTTTLNDEASIDGRLWNVGRGVVTGEIDSWESMAGSTVADFFVVGDVRDLIVHGLVKDDGDELILTLSAVGIATTAWPPADPAVSMIKAARKSQSISEPIVKQLSNAASNYKNAPGPKTQQALIDTMKPIWDLGGKCKSWSQFKLMLKHSDSIDQLRTLNKIMDHGPQTAKQMNRMFAVCSHTGKQFKNLFKLLNKGGQKGCDAIYTVIRKGPPGIKWLAKNPKLLTRLTKIGYKNTKWGYNEALATYGRKVIWVRNIIIVVCIGLIIACTPFFRLLRLPLLIGAGVRRVIMLPVIFLVCCLIAALLTLFYDPITVLFNNPQAKNAYAQARDYIREIRTHLQEDDTVDPNDHFRRQSIAPIIRSSDGSQWIFCARKDIGFDWPEIQDGEISKVSYIISKRGDNPASAPTPDRIHVYKPYPLLCAIPLNDVIQHQEAKAPLSLDAFKEKPPLYFMQGHDHIKGFSAKDYIVSKGGIAVDMKTPANQPIRFGDFLMTSDGSLAGFYTNDRNLLTIKPDFHKHMVQIIRCNEVNNSGYHQQFVDDIKYIP